MPCMCAIAVLVAAVVGSVSLPGGAQADSAASTPTDMPVAPSSSARPASVSVWLQSGPASFETDKLGGYPGARLIESGVRWRHTLYRSGWFAVATIPDLVTVTSLTRVSGWRAGWFYKDPAEFDSVFIRYPSHDGHAFGVGTLPLAIRAALAERKPLGAFLDLSVGLHYFSRPIPEERATRLNAQLMAGTGLRVGMGGRLEAEFAYRLVHFSNAGFAVRNPGLNFHQIAVGAGFRRRN